MPTQSQYNDCPKEIRDFLFYMLTIKGRSARTVEAYYIDLRTFFRYILSVKDSRFFKKPLEDIDILDMSFSVVSGITLSDVYSFLNHAVSDRGNNAKTRSRKVSSIRVFFKYLTATAALMEQNPVKDLEMPSVRKSLPKYLTLEESIELLAKIATKYPERDYCIVTLLINCGMRLSELVGINIEDIRDNTIKLLGKGNKERIIYLNGACIHALEQYIRIRAAVTTVKDKGALLLSRNGRRLTPRRVEQIVEECLSFAGLSGKGYSPHKLRHTAATLMYQHGNVDIRVLKELLGHANLATTEIYTHVSSTQLEQAADRSPLACVIIDKKLTTSEIGDSKEE
jgi:site-specific recombinase XerD